MKKLYRIDLFISHAWIFHNEWKEFVDWVNKIEELEWRNFSVPWHDPAFLPSTEIGYKNITTNLKTQVIPCDLCIILTDLYKQNRNIKWLDLIQGYAAEAKVPILYFGKNNDAKILKTKNQISINNWDFKTVNKHIIEYAKIL